MNGSCVSGVYADDSTDGNNQLRIYYMRDNNHTFVRLPLDVEEAIKVLELEFVSGWSYGMVASKYQQSPPYVHGEGRGCWDSFVTKVRSYYCAIMSAYTSDNDLRADG